MQLLVGNMDQFMISHFGSAAVAAIGNGNQVMNVVIIVLTTMSTAATILLTQHIGAGRVGEECERDRHRGRYGQRRVQLSGGPVFAVGAGTGLSSPADAGGRL